NDVALLTLSLAAPTWLICALRLMDSAKPAGLSDAFTSCEPEESRESDSFSILVELLRLLALLSAALFVLIIITNSFLESPLAGSSASRHPCHVVDFSPGIHRFPDWLFVAANRHCRL